MTVLHPVEQLLVVMLVMSAAMVCLWLIQRRTGDAGTVDVAWSAGLGFAALLYALSSDGAIERRVILALVAGTWSLRLATYLLRDRIFGGKEEDGRYQRLRSRWGSRAQFNFLIFFQFQALLVPLFSLPFLVVAHNGTPSPNLADLAGIAIFLVSLLGESTADRQLARFRSDPENQGKTCRYGLWRYSRHPNYFFEWLHWWAYVMLAAGASYWWVTLFGPVLMLIFLYKITGIPTTEEQAIASRGEDYRQYQRTTSQFFPWFPKES